MAESPRSPAAGTGATLRLVVKSDLKLLLECVVCGGTLRDPVLFDGCLHSACRKCFDDLRSGCASNGERTGGNAAGIPGSCAGNDDDTGGSGFRESGDTRGDSADCSSNHGEGSDGGSGDGVAGDVCRGSDAGGGTSVGEGQIEPGSDSTGESASSGCGDGSGRGDVASTAAAAAAEANAVGSESCGNVVPVSCPACGAAPAPAAANSLKTNVFVSSLQRAKAITCGGEVSCDFCPSDKETLPQRAERWCAECNKCICGQCTGWHTKFNKDHVTKPLASGSSSGGGGGGMCCDTCAEEGNPNCLATSWCPDCANVLCDTCVQWHNRFQRAHRSQALAAGDVIVNQSLLTAPPCREHGARTEMYCRSCDSLWCPDCAKPCLESSHDVYVFDGARTKEYVERAKADMMAAEKQLFDKAALLSPPQPPSNDSASQSADDDSESDELAEALESAMAADQVTMSGNRQCAVDAVGRAFDELEGRVKNHYEQLRRSLQLPDKQQQQTDGSKSVRMTKSALRAAVGQALVYSRTLLQMADESIVLGQHAPVLAGLRLLWDRAERATNLLPVLEQLKPIVQVLDEASFDSLLAANVLRLLPVVGQKTAQPTQTLPAVAGSSGATVTASPTQPDSRDGLMASCSGPAGDRVVGNDADVDDDDDGGGIGVGDAICQIVTDGNLRDVALLDDGRVLIADAGKGLRQFSSTGKKLATWHAPKGGDRSKSGVVSTVCALDDGRVAVGVISASCVVLLRWAPTAGSEPASEQSGRWIEDGQIKLDGAPYHLGARRDALAVVLARSDQHKVDIGAVSAVVGSNWGPGPRVDVVSLGSEPLRKYDIGYQVVAVLLTDEAVVVSSDDKVKASAGGTRSSYVVDAYDRRLPPSSGGGAAAESGPSPRRLWRFECDEHAHDLCVATASSSSSSVIYVALPHSRRIVAIDGASGQWLVDVVSGGTAVAAVPSASGKPLRLAVSRPRRKAGSTSGSGGARGRPLLAVMYNGTAVAVTVHPVGGGGADE